jgi:CRISPR/Cas system Type II protein with McrA/HNH and RuvC-like nuclease domain
MEEPKRRKLSKKIRFEVFKRDNFTCQYCGRKAPDVVLEVDHVNPVAKGGTNNIMNLITSCVECNKGKGKDVLSENQTLEKERKQLEMLQDRREQMKMMMQWQNELLAFEDEQVNFIESILQDEEHVLNERGRAKMKDAIDRFGFDVMVKAAKIAKVKYIDLNERCQKVGGIAYNKVFVTKEW